MILPILHSKDYAYARMKQCSGVRYAPNLVNRAGRRTNSD